VGGFTLRVPPGGRQLDTVCFASGAMDLAVQSAPVRLRLSSFSMSARYNGNTDELTGQLNLFMLLGDEDRNRVGDVVGAEAGLGGLGLQPLDLCAFAALPPTLESCRTPDSPFENCREGRCTDSDTCTGFILLFDFTAVRAPNANLPGLRCD